MKGWSLTKNQEVSGDVESLRVVSNVVSVSGAVVRGQAAMWADLHLVWGLAPTRATSRLKQLLPVFTSKGTLTSPFSFWLPCRD